MMASSNSLDEYIKRNKLKIIKYESLKKPVIQRKRRTKAEISKDDAMLEINAIKRVISLIRHSIRDYPAWTRAYCSAITQAEIEIENIRKKNCLI